MNQQTHHLISTNNPSFDDTIKAPSTPNHEGTIIINEANGNCSSQGNVITSNISMSSTAIPPSASSSSSSLILTTPPPSPPPPPPQQNANATISNNSNNNNIKLNLHNSATTRLSTESDGHQSTDSNSTFEIIDLESPSDNEEWYRINNGNNGKYQLATNASILKQTANTIIPSTSIRNIENDTVIDGNDGDTDIGQSSYLENENSDSNRLFRKCTKYNDRLRTTPPSKEEKQRQNEEILILESSSISSETGSWESVFPQHRNTNSTDTITPTSTTNDILGNIPGESSSNDIGTAKPTRTISKNIILPKNASDIKDSCSTFLLNERNHSIDSTHNHHINSATPSGCTSSMGACFIDASSLFDETELTMPSASFTPPVPPPPSNRESLNFQVHDQSSQNQFYNQQRQRLNSYEIADGLPPEKHRLTMEEIEAAEEENAVPKLIKNLSDEEKLMKRSDSGNNRIEYDIKDQYSLTDTQPTTTINKNTIPSSATSSAETTTMRRQGTYELCDESMNDHKLRKQQEQEKKQGHFLFQNSIQQFSGHIIDSNIKNQYFPQFHNDNNLNYQCFPNVTKLHEHGNNSVGMESRMPETESIFYPDTPHNSIVNVDSSANSSLQNDVTLTTAYEKPMVQEKSNASSMDSTSPPSTTITAAPTTTTTNGIRIPKRTQKCDESAPILSGGASIKDFTPKQCESPMIRRKTDTCPIVSGGLTTMNLRNDEDNDNSIYDDDSSDIDTRPSKKSQKISALNSWIVDMSDCNDNGRRRRSESSSSNSTTTTAASTTTNVSSDNALTTVNPSNGGNGSKQTSGLGFYVSLDDMKPPKENLLQKCLSISSAASTISNASTNNDLSMKRSTGFYIDLSENENSRTNTPPPSQALSTTASRTHINIMPHVGAGVQQGRSSNLSSESEAGLDNDKKNIFSMFIEFGEKKEIAKQLNTFKSKLSNTIYNNKQSQSCDESRDNNKGVSQLQNDNGGIKCDNNLSVKPSTTTTIASISAGGAEQSSSVNSTNYMFIESDSPVIRRSQSPSRNPATNGVNKIVQRHSWNLTTKDNSTLPSNVNHKRSASLSSDKSGIMNILDKIPFITKASNQSIENNVNSTYDEFGYGSKSELSTTFSNNSISSGNSNSTNINGKTYSKRNGLDEDGDADDDEDNKNNNNGNGGNRNDHNRRTRRHRKDVNINETFDKSSQGSLTDGVFSKTSTPTSATATTITTTDDTDDTPTFQNDLNEENLTGSTGSTANNNHSITTSTSTTVNRIPIMDTIDETKEIVIKNPTQIGFDQEHYDKTLRTMETIQATIEKQKLLLESVAEESSSFVKLSDLDRTPSLRFIKDSLKQSGNNGNYISKSFSSYRSGKMYTDSKFGVHRTTWSNMSASTGTNLSHLASSVENLRSLSRLFPHLSRDLSNSLPADIPMDVIRKSPNEYHQEYIQSDLSCTSSLTSSFSRSGIDSADESSLSCRQPRRLGEDLLKMFLQEIATDVVVEVSGRRMRAHKCILRSRCQYFAAILAGGWVQSAGNVISIPGYSYGAVHFALCHIYSGAAHPPESISLMELAALSDLLGLEGLKEVTAHALKTNYCHNFHKPCSSCTEGILQVFPITLNHGLDDLYRKCIRWVCKYYVKVWPTRPFAQLPQDLIYRCRQHIIAHMTSETVLSILLDCDHMLSLLAPCRWGIHIENTVRDVIDSAHAYIFDHFASLIASDGFLSLGHGQSWNISRLENLLLRIASTLAPEQACKSYQRITRLHAVLGRGKVLKLQTLFGLHNLNNGRLIADGNSNTLVDAHENNDDDDDQEDMNWNPEFIRLVGALLLTLEQCLTKQCARAMRNNQWARMDIELRRKIQKLACLSDPITASNVIRSRPNSGNNFNLTNNKPMTYNSTSQNSRSQDLYQVKLAIQAHSKRTQSQDTQLYRATTHTQTNNGERNAVDKSCQAASHHEPRSKERIVPGGSTKILKSSSHTQVPDMITKTSISKRTTGGIERSQSFAGHRRSKSDTVPKSIIDSKQQPPVGLNDHKSQIPSRLLSVKPRYLQPRNPRIEITKNQSTSNIPTIVMQKGKQISSSDSSTRTSSPAAHVASSAAINTNNKYRKIPLVQKCTSDTRTMSRDSLSSPAKHSGESNKNIGNLVNKPNNNNNNNNNEITMDSLGESMISSIRTDKTLSQESLVRVDMKKSKENLIKPNLKTAFSRSTPAINKESVKPTITNGLHYHPHPHPITNGTTKKLFTKCTITNQQSSTTNSPSASSSATTKSGKLSSVSSPRDGYRGRSAPITNELPARKSFLSAKSKEILAAKKKQQLLKESQSTKSVPNTINEKLNAVNKSQSTSNILHRQYSSSASSCVSNPSGNNPIQHTTLHLRRTSKLQPPPLQPQQQLSNNITILNSTILNPTQSSVRKMVTTPSINIKMSVNNNNIINRKLSKCNNKDKKCSTQQHEPTATSAMPTAPASTITKVNIEIESDESLPQKIESKLERSSTFCKEFSDIPNSKLQEIE